MPLSKERKNRFISAPRISAKKKLKLYGKKIFQGVRDKEEESACFFTAYDISPGGSDCVIKNEFKYLRSQVGGVPVVDKVYFIGSPLSEVAMMSQKSYLLQLKKVKKYFSDMPLVYVAHRRDSEKKLDKIKNELNIEVVLFDYPIEYQLAIIGPRPKVFASFFSAALDSCRLVFGNKLKIMSFWLDMKESPKRDKVESIYSSYESSISDDFIVVKEY